MVPVNIRAYFSFKDRGSVLYIRDEEFNSNEPHYFIVLTCGEDVILLCSATSNIEGRRKYVTSRNLDPETLVVLGPEDYNNLSKNTVIDCNQVHIKNKAWLTEKVKETGKFNLDPIPDDIYKKIINGVLKSRLVEEEVKDILRNL